MMLDHIIQKLNQTGADGWELTEKKETRWEFYFIGQRLDQNRSVRIRETEIKLFKKSADGAFLGSASDVISPTASDDEIDQILKKLVYQAGLVKNPVYTLSDRPLPDNGLTEPDIAAIAKDCIQALSSVPETETSRINSYEIFVSGLTRHFLNSRGVTFTCTYPSTEMEVVVNARRGEKEIELHRIFRCGTCDRERLAADIGRVMKFGVDRLHAEPTPNLGHFDVLFSTADATEIYQYFSDRMHADYVARKMSDWKIGEPVAAAGGGDRVTLQAVSYLPNSSMNFPADREGNLIFDRYLIKDGIAETYCGSRQFSCYLGMEKSSLVTNLKVSGGKSTEEEIRKRDYLEVVEFSDFQVDSMSGDIAGEIRLGYLHRGGQVKIVTGGSVSGTMAGAAGEMIFSKETAQYDNWEIPKITVLKNLRVAGI